MAGRKNQTLVELATSILEKAKQLENAAGKSPTFLEDTLSGLPENLDFIRRDLIDETATLNALVRGPSGLLYGRVAQACFYYVRLKSNFWVSNQAALINISPRNPSPCA